MRKFIELFAWGCLLGSSTAWADPDDTLSLVVGAGVARDDNLFKAPSGRETSDDIRSATFGLKFDKQYSLQQFKVDASMTEYRYQENSYLDYTGKNLNAVWAWKLSPSLYGNLSTSYVDSMISFIDYEAVSRERRRNIRTLRNSRFDVEWEALGPLHVISSAIHTDQENSQTFVQDDNYTAASGEVGLKYVTSAQSSLALVRRKTSGDYAREANSLTLQDSGFQQDDTEMRFFWMPTLKTAVFGRVGYVERNYDNFSARDYSGRVGSLDVNWGITEKLSMLLSARRDLNAYQELGNSFDSYSSYFSSDTYTLSPTWDITEKTRLRLRFSREDRDYEGTVVNGNPLRQDRIDYRGISLEWAPRKSVNVSLDYTRQSRESNRDRYDFTGNLYKLTLILNF